MRDIVLLLLTFALTAQSLLSSGLLQCYLQWYNHTYQITRAFPFLRPGEEDLPQASCADVIVVSRCGHLNFHGTRPI